MYKKWGTSWSTVGFQGEVGDLTTTLAFQRHGSRGVRGRQSQRPQDPREATQDRARVEHQRTQFARAEVSSPGPSPDCTHLRAICAADVSTYRAACYISPATRASLTVLGERSALDCTCATACHYGHRKSCRALLQHGGANCHLIAEPNGETPLHLAAIGGHQPCCKLLLQYQVRRGPLSVGPSPVRVGPVAHGPCDAAVDRTLAPTVGLGELGRLRLPCRRQSRTR